MQVDRLSLTSFRSYTGLDASFSGGPQLIVGPNAAGKTNLLEALAVLGTGSSHRGAVDAELIAWQAPFARLEARIGMDAGHDGVLEVVLGRGDVATGRKRIRVNGTARRATSLATVLRVVVFAPEDMLLVAGSPALRRSAFDRLLKQRIPAASASLGTYNRALQQRNVLLRSIREGLSGRDELRYWDDVVCEEGGRIVGWRRELLGELAAPLALAHAEIAPHEGELTLRYLTNAPSSADERPGDTLRRRLAETWEKEMWNGATLVGPHRDDVAFELDGRDLAGFASRGQQRTAILALKLGELELLTRLDGRPPLLLLDDVFSELDPDRRAHLVRRIRELPQSFVTTTTLDDLDSALVRASTAWAVTQGRLRAVSTVRAAVAS